MNFAPFAFLNKPTGGGVDTDAQAYLNAITTAGGTYTSAQETAVYTLFSNLKSYGFYSKIKGMYPFIGGTAASHAINAVNPSGTGQGSGKLVFSGGWTHTLSGSTANGSNSYANTQLEVDTDINFPNGHYSFQQNNPSPQNVGWDGYYRSDEGRVFGLNFITGTEISLGLWFLSGSLGTLPNYTDIFTGVRDATDNGILYRNTTAFYTDTTSRAAFSTKGNYFIGALNENGSPNYYNNNQYTFYTLGEKITSSEISDWNTIWSSFLNDKKPQPLAVDYLVVAGGGGGGRGNARAGGGGAGGYISSGTTISPSSSVSITIGGGGAGQTASDNTSGANGSNSVFGSTTATGGGGGASDSTNAAANSGGSGGGGAAAGGLAYNGGAGVSGQGNRGGDKSSTSNTGACGGGGAGSAGVDYLGGAGSSTNGGDGLQWLNGIYYAGGGGGGGPVPSGTGGLGGGGNGTLGTTPGTAGGTNTGGGGGGGGNSTTTDQRNGKNGGSGTVIVRYLGAPRATGGTITESGGYTYHTFTSSGTFTY